MTQAIAGQIDQVEIFVKEGCPFCRGLKRKLQHDGTAHLEHDVEKDHEALQRMLALNGGRRNVPTVLAEGQVIVGFHGM
jgi:mycoredoxin